MKTTIDAAGRLVLPKAIRRAANLQPGSELEVRNVGDHIEIEPVTAKIRFKKEGSFVVAETAVPPARPLTVETVEETRRAILQQRGGGRSEKE